jgi:pyruvate/2-oxoglutarate dehydrogenase complex dihydrolipoamide dehydrogenase (E3) component
MSEHFDAVVVGAGPAGEVAASRLPRLGLRVALVEKELVGGECAYWACIPSKTLLRPPEARADARRAAGLEEPAQRWKEIVDYRDYMIRNLDDTGAVESRERSGVRVFKGQARITGPGVIDVDGTTLETSRIIIATGSEPAIPPIEGIEQAGYWTNREATTLTEVPRDLIVLGGGPVGIELGQALRRYGAQVTIVDAAERMLAGEHPAVGEQIAEALSADGIELRLGNQVARADRDADRKRVRLANGEELSAEQLLVATGRRPSIEGLGLELIGIEPGEHGIEVDERCRAGEGVWAIGDVTGVAQLTHVGKYQARIACADIGGRDVSADYSAIPRVVFSDPEVAAVGLTPQQANAQGLDCVEAFTDLLEIARTETYGKGLGGSLGVLADRDRRVLVGAWAVGPLAGEWIHQAVLAIKTATPVDVLLDTVAQFPTFSEAYLGAIERLDL